MIHVNFHYSTYFFFLVKKNIILIAYFQGKYLSWIHSLSLSSHFYFHFLNLSFFYWITYYIYHFLPLFFFSSYSLFFPFPLTVQHTYISNRYSSYPEFSFFNNFYSWWQIIWLVATYYYKLMAVKRMRNMLAMNLTLPLLDRHYQYTITIIFRS